MKRYNPYEFGGVHVIQITLQDEGYFGHITQRIGGNCHGLNMLDFDFENETDFTNSACSNDCQLSYDEEYDVFTAILSDENGNTLSVEGDFREFNNMIVKLEIIGFESEQKGESE